MAGEWLTRAPECLLQPTYPRAKTPHVVIGYGLCPRSGVYALWTETNLEGVHLRTTEAGRTRTERRERAAKEVRDLLAQLYRSFVLWGSVYGDANQHDEQGEMRERVAKLLGEFSGHYLPRTVWLDEATRKKIEVFLKKSEGLYRELSAEIRSEERR